MEKIKVLIVAGAMDVGGIENQLMHLLRNADKNRFQIDFTSTMQDAFYREEIESLGGKFLLIPEMNWRKPWEYCKAMLHIMKEGKYDIVHSHELFHSGITLAIAKKAGVPCRIAHAHNWCDDDGTGRKRSWVRSIYNSVMRMMILRCSTSQIACSTWAGKFLYGEEILNKDSYHLVYNSVDTKKFLDCYRQTETGEWCEEDGWKHVINVARITAVKNQKFLVQIASELKKRNEKIKILCAGNGDKAYIEEVQALIKKENVDSHFQLLGVRKDIDVLMRKSSAFVLPSKYEGMPLVLIEAQASGLPCVVADTFSREVDFGIQTVKWMDLEEGVAAWADALVEAVKKEKALKTDVEASVKKNRFDSKMFAQTLCDLYQSEYSRRKK